MSRETEPSKQRLLRKIRRVTGRIRPAPVLKCIAALPDSRLRQRLSAAFDPNEIRRDVPYVAGSKIVTVAHGGLPMRVDLNDHIGFRYLMNGAFDPGFLALARTFPLGEDAILLDIGANIGTECITVAAQTGCAIIAVEASKPNAALLIENATLNDVRLRTHIVAVVDDETAAAQPWLEFQVNRGNTGANSIFEGWSPSVDGAGREWVATATLDTLLSDHEIARIALAKIDVEGAEPMALRGASRLRSAGVPIAFEYIPRHDPTGGLEGMIAMLRADYDLHGTDGAGQLVPFDPDRAYENAIALPRR